MYTTELNKNVKPIETSEDPELVAAFEARVAADLLTHTVSVK